MDMGGMDHGGDSACKISMLWNWYTIDACFLAESWHVKSRGAFAATCIGVILLVVTLEALRRLGKEYDTYLVRQFQSHLAAQAKAKRICLDDRTTATFRATLLQQLVRAFIYAVTFGLAYIAMLLAMYFNGYIIICIVIGAGLGKVLCDWMVVEVALAPLCGAGREQGEPMTTAANAAAAAALPREGTMCCA